MIFVTPLRQFIRPTPPIHSWDTGLTAQHRGAFVVPGLWPSATPARCLPNAEAGGMESWYYEPDMTWHDMMMIPDLHSATPFRMEQVAALLVQKTLHLSTRPMWFYRNTQTVSLRWHVQRNTMKYICRQRHQKKPPRLAAGRPGHSHLPPKDRRNPACTAESRWFCCQQWHQLANLKDSNCTGTELTVYLRGGHACCLSNQCSEIGTPKVNQTWILYIQLKTDTTTDSVPCMVWRTLPFRCASVAGPLRHQSPPPSEMLGRSLSRLRPGASRNFRVSCSSGRHHRNPGLSVRRQCLESKLLVHSRPRIDDSMKIPW